MDTNRIIAALCKISRKTPERIQPHLSLASLGVSSSFGLSALRSLLEVQSSAKLAPLNANMKVADIIRLAAKGSDLTAGAELPPRVPTTAGDGAEAPANGFGANLPYAIGLGMDMQDFASLPIAADYRTHEFYISHFTPQEIATSLLRTDPRAHLCGIFCAKEAAKKSQPDLLNLRMTDFFVTHDPAGRPALHIVDEHRLKNRFRFLISITHTSEIAAATCVAIGV